MVTGIFRIPNQQTTAGGGDVSVGVPLLAGPENGLLAPAANFLTRGDVGGPVYNPIVLYGPDGCGTSPLARGLAAAYCHRDGATVSWFNADTFAAKIAHRSDRLRDAFVAAPVVVIHEIEKFRSRTAAQASLQQWIDLRLLAQRPLLVTAGAAPGALDMLIPTLRSRLAGGLVVPLSQPRLATRLAMVLAYAEAAGVRITPEAAELLARRVDQSWTELVAAITELLKLRRSGPPATPLDAACVRSYVDLQPTTALWTLAQITGKVARYYGIAQAELRGRSRRKAVATARSVTMYLARVSGAYSLKKIGKHLGNRDHTTVLHSCRKVARQLAEDPAVRQAVHQLKQDLRKTP